MPTWDEIRARDTGKGEAYYGEGQLARKFTQERREAEAADAEWRESPAGQLAKAESELRVLAASMTPAEWARMHEERGVPVPPQPREQDLPLGERQQIADARLAEVFRKRAGGQ